MKKLLTRLLLIVIVGALCVGFCACNKGKEQQGDNSVVYFTYIEYDSAEAVMIAHISQSHSTASEAKNIALENVEFKRNSQSVQDGEFWLNYEVNYFIDGEQLFSVVNSFITQDDIIRDEIIYDRLKIVFDYVTIYKSTVSDGDVVKSGRNYVHKCEVTAQETVLTFSRRSPYAASWYSLVVSIVLTVVAVGVCAYCAFGGKYGKRG